MKKLNILWEKTLMCMGMLFTIRLSRGVTDWRAIISQIKQDPKGICFSFENRKSKSLKLKVFLRQ